MIYIYESCINVVVFLKCYVACLIHRVGVAVVKVPRWEVGQVFLALEVMLVVVRALCGWDNHAGNDLAQ